MQHKHSETCHVVSIMFHRFVLLTICTYLLIVRIVLSYRFGSLLLCPDGTNLLDGCFPQHLAQTVGVARPSDFDEHVAAASMFHGADELVVPIQNALRCAVFSTG